MLHTSDTRTRPAQPNSGEYVSSGDEAPRAPDQQKNVWWLVLVGLAAVVLCAPFFRILIFLGDEGILLRQAELILQGKTLYLDFFQFLPPGTVLLIAAWFSIAGVSFTAARVLAVLTFVGIACFTYLGCRQASRNSPLSALLAIGWVMFSAWPWMQVSYHWFTTLLSMASLWAALVGVEQHQHNLRWPGIAGAAAGASPMFIPHFGALTMLAGLVGFLNLREHKAQLSAYLFGCALAPAAILVYLLQHHTLVPAFDEVVRYTATHYTSINSVPWGFSPGVFYSRPLKYVFGIAALLMLAACAYDWRAALSSRRLRLCAAFALAGFLGCFPRPDITHISTALPLSLPLIAYSSTRLTQSWRPLYRYAAVAVLIGLYANSFLEFKVPVGQALRADVVSSPRGEVAVLGPFTQKRGLSELLAAIAATPSGDAYLFYPYDAMLAFLAGREQVSKYDLFTPWYTTPDQYEETCRSVMRQASWIVIDRLWTEDWQTWKGTFPSMPDTKPRETLEFEQALDKSSEPVPNTHSLELRHRREDGTESVCDGID